MTECDKQAFIGLTDIELSETQGGSIVAGIAVVAGGVGIFMGGRAIGQDLKRIFG